MSLDVIRCRTQMECPAVKQHHSNIDSYITRCDHALAKPIKVCRIERIKIELRFSIFCTSRTSSCPRLRRHAEMETSSSRLRFELFPPPETNKVMTMLF